MKDKRVLPIIPASVIKEAVNAVVSAIGTGDAMKIEAARVNLRETMAYIKQFNRRGKDA